MDIEKLEAMVKPSNNEKGYIPSEAMELGYEFANDYDWDKEWEAFDPIEACADAYVAGIRFAIEKLKEN